MKRVIALSLIAAVAAVGAGVFLAPQSYADQPKGPAAVAAPAAPAKAPAAPAASAPSVKKPDEKKQDGKAAIPKKPVLKKKHTAKKPAAVTGKDKAPATKPGLQPKAKDNSNPDVKKK